MGVLMDAEATVMHLTEGHRIKNALIALAVVVICAFAFEWLQEHDARIHAEANTAIQQAKVDAQEKSIKDRNAATVVANQALQKTDKAVKTPAQAVAAQGTLGLNLPAPTFQFDAKLPDQVKTGDLVVPQADIVPIFHQINACQQNQNLLSTCNKNLIDMTGERDEQKKKSDVWEKTAKGGSKFHRTLSTLEKLAVGAAVGYAIAKVY